VSIVLLTMAPFCSVLFCDICVISLLVVLVRLSVTVQMTYDVLMGTLNRTHSLTNGSLLMLNRPMVAIRAAVTWVQLGRAVRRVRPRQAPAVLHLRQSPMTSGSRQCICSPAARRQ